MIDARQIDMKRQAVFQFPCFSFFEVGWIHQPLHSFNYGEFQALIRITAQLLQHVQGERIVRWLARFFLSNEFGLNLMRLQSQSRGFPSNFLATLVIISGVEQKHQSLFHLMELPFLSAEVEPHIEPFF